MDKSRRINIIFTAMTIQKSIRCVALSRYIPMGGSLEERLSDIEETLSSAYIRYAGDNAFDSNCMIVSCMGMDIGMVNADDTHYVAPLLKDRVECEATFSRVYRREGHTPVVFFDVTVDVGDVLLQPAEEWANWHYDGVQLQKIGGIADIPFLAQMIKRCVSGGCDADDAVMRRYIERFISASEIDPSVETSNAYDDIIFFMEWKGGGVYDRCRDELQHANTGRRTERRYRHMMEQWWPKFVADNTANMSYRLALKMRSEGRELNDSILEKVYADIDGTLALLPFDMYADMSDISRMWCKMFYSHIPQEKFCEVMSALVLHAAFRDAFSGKRPLIDSRTVIKNYKVMGDYINRQQISIEKSHGRF